MKMESVIKVALFLGLLVVFTACGNPMMGAGDGSATIASANQLPILYYPAVCTCPTGNCGSVRAPTYSTDSGSQPYWCKNPPSSTTTTTTGTSQ